MNDQQLDRTLRSIGKKCFVTYFCKFDDTSLSIEDVAEILMRDRRYKEKASPTRVSNARRIIREGRAKDALMIISASPRMSSEIVAKAKRLAAGL